MLDIVIVRFIYLYISFNPQTLLGKTSCFLHFTDEEAGLDRLVTCTGLHSFINGVTEICAGSHIVHMLFKKKSRMKEFNATDMLITSSLPFSYCQKPQTHEQSTCSAKMSERWWESFFSFKLLQ